MHVTTVLAILLVLQCSELCVAIKVPIAWNDRENSEVKQNNFDDDEFSVEIFKPSIQQQPVPIEYFQYTAKKPQFAVDIATFHGVPSPSSHYKAYPVRPYTRKEKPNLGQHRLQDQKREIYVPLQKYIKDNEHHTSHIIPIISNYEIYHPYKAEQPALQKLYKDPVLDKIRNDLRDTSKRLQNYEKEAGKPDIEKEEYNESPDEIDRKKVPQQNIPTQYEVHHPQRRPVYYKPLPKFHNREQILNKKFMHPWNQNYVKIRPVHYQPLKGHLQKLRQHHALTYDDDRNQYPQVPVAEEIEEQPEGYDIYEKGKDKYVQLRNNVDESINQAIRENRPVESPKLELQNEEKCEDDEEDEFVPVKNYAQVRKTETTKHLPREAALEDADTYEEIRNAPRLKEAVKTTKAQTVYTEEGYEDSAYDHAGEQKHASDHEGHGGYLKENEVSGGKYKIPSLDVGYDDNQGSAYRDQLLHGKKWLNSNKDVNEEIESEKYSEAEHDQSVESDVQIDQDGPNEDDIQRNKRENESSENPNDEINKKLENDHDLSKREVNFKVPEINIDSTYLTEDEILEIAKAKVVDNVDLKNKYPYYFKNLTSVHRDSPLRYAENLKFIPKKSDGGTEFYDSRSKLECPEVDDKVDAIPKKLKKKGHPNSQEDEESNAEEDDPVEEQPRLKGLGDKIDCFKTKYFGENPLDSPFFKEEIIANPEPVTAPNLITFKLTKPKELSLHESNVSNNLIGSTKIFREQNENDVFKIIEKLRNGQNELKASVTKENQELLASLQNPINSSHENISQIFQPSHVHSDLLKNNKSNLKTTKSYIHSSHQIPNHTHIADNNRNITYNYFKNKEDVTKLPPVVRKKRGAPFVYEPYKIIKDGQVQESKKTTTTGNISPLIKQLQSSRVVDKVTKPDSDNQQVTKRNTNPKTYKDIGKKDRVQTKNSKDITDEVKFVDVNIDKRRGEPRYELRPSNHKPEYLSVENKKAMSRQEYEAQSQRSQILENVETTKKPTSVDVQDSAASNTVQRTIATTSSPKEVKNLPQKGSPSELEEEYDDDYEYEDDEVERVIASSTTTTTTTTTPKPIFRKKTRTTTTVKPEEETETETPKLRLVTRFRTPPPIEENKHELANIKKASKNDENEDKNIPKYKEKKKKSTTRTLVTDTKRYGEDDSDDTRKEVDALIGIQHDMEDYMPNYEKEELRRSKEDSSPEFSDEDDDDESDEDEEDDDEDEDENSDIGEDIEVGSKHHEPPVTTPEPTKRTLVRTTDAPVSTTEAINANSEVKPIISKKKIEIHKELPVNKSAPHITQFKEDIEEVEIIKELPRKPANKPHKNREVLELYKDENLAKQINKLKDVEVFKENLDLTNGPKHGGNYRSAKLEELIDDSSTLRPMHGGNLKVEKKDDIAEIENDAEASQSENKKSVELDTHYKPGGRMHGGNLKSFSDFKNSRRPSGRSAKLTELSETTEHIPRARHGGNLRSVQDSARWRGNKKSERLTELGDHDGENDDDSSGSGYGTSSKSYGSGRQGGRPMHGGNYRSAKIIQADSSIEATPKPQRRVPKTRERTSKEAKNKAAVLLNSFAQAVPILTTTPAYILDPSKRMYYYVEA